jgi:hypothetical protein
MKTFLGAKKKQLDRSAIKALVGINLLATPGLGTLISGRYLAGLAQLGLACAGFGLVLWWYLYLFKSIVGGGEAGHAWMWQLGLLCLGISWLGALWSSLRMLRAKPEPGSVPPILNG